MRIPVATKTGRGRSIPLNPEKLVNLYAEVAPQGSRSPVAVHGTPGTTLHSDLGQGLYRGAYFVSSLDRLFVVLSLVLYEVKSDGSFVTRGTIGGSGRVGISDNGSQMVITSVGISYVFTFASNSLSPISDNDFPNSRTVTFKGGFFVFSNSQAGSRGQIVTSELYDGTEYDGLDFATAEYSSDNLVREFVDHDQLILFGTNTIEYWFQVAAAFPFAPQQGAVVEKGLGARWSVAKLDNSVIFLDSDGIVRRLNGNTPVRISTHEVEYHISRGPWKTDDSSAVEGAFADVYVQEGHEFYILTVPGTCTKVYDAATGLWHDRLSRDYDTSRLGFYVKAFGRQLACDLFNGKIYELSLDVYQENGAPLVSELIFPQLNEEDRRIIVNRFRLDMEVGFKSRQVLSSFDFGSGVWTQKTSQFSTTSIREAGFGNGVFLAVGEDGKLSKSTDGGNTWSLKSSGFGASAIRDALYGQNVWLISGNDGKQATSTDNGETWSVIRSGGDTINGTDFNGSLWVACGNSARLETSTDLATWTTRTSPFSGDTHFWVSYGAGLWVTVGDAGKLATSSDGITWTLRTSSFGSTTIRSVEYSNGLWVAVGDSGKLATSPDGVSWTQQTSSFATSDIKEVGFGDGIWIAAGFDGKIASSLNGTSWTQVADSSFSGTNIQALVFGDGVFVAAGDSGKLAILPAIRSQSVIESPTEEYITLDVSGNTRTYNLAQLWRPMGGQGEYSARPIWRRLGQHENFTPRIRISAPVKRALYSAYMDAELCD